MDLERYGSRRIAWEKYPELNSEPEAKRWLELRDLKGWPQNTLDTYAKALEAYLLFLEEAGFDLLKVTELEVAYYINFMRMEGSRSERNPRSPLSEATVRLRLSVVRRLYDDLVRRELMLEHPLHPLPAREWSGERPPSLSVGYQAFPWIPTRQEWSDFLREARDEPLRNRLMVLLAYEGALRRGSLVTLEFRDVDLDHRLIYIRPDNVKGGRGIVVRFSEPTALLYQKYLALLKERFSIDGRGKARIFRSESNRNYGQPITLSAWNKVITKIAKRAGLPELSTHTFRHLRLTHMARAKFDILYIANYAGHASFTEHHALHPPKRA